VHAARRQLERPARGDADEPAVRVELIEQRRDVVLVGAASVEQHERALGLPRRRPDGVCEVVEAGHRDDSLWRAAAALDILAAVTGDEQGRAREAAARAAVERIEEGMTIGLGSGRAVWRAIELIGERWGGRPPIRSAFASERTRELAAAVGIEAVELDGELRLDVAIDGADEIDPQLGLIKGGGAALLREKIVVIAARRFLVVAEAGKRVTRLGERFKLPVEVVRFGWRDTRKRLLELLPSAELRLDGDSPRVTDENHYLLDCDLPRERDLLKLGQSIKATVGVVEHGLFIGLATEALLGTPQGAVEVLTP
jgi:ribose 5-phosphate isomerase A